MELETLFQRNKNSHLQYYKEFVSQLVESLISNLKVVGSTPT